jgi:hypothetical protein
MAAAGAHSGRRSRRSGNDRAAAAALAATAALLVAAAAWPHQAAATRVLLQQQPAAPQFGSLLQGLPLKEILGGSAKAFDAWRKGKEQLAQQKANGGPEGEVVGSDPARLRGAVPEPPGSGARGQQQLINSSMEYVPPNKQLLVYNTTGFVGGFALPAEPKDGKFSLLPAGCALAEQASGAAAASPSSSSSPNLCWSVKLEANAGSNALEAGKSDGLITTDSLNATEAARDMALSDFARLTLRYGQLSLDDGIAGVPVPFDFEWVVTAREGALLNGSAKGSPKAVVKARMWGMWTNGEPAIPLRSAIFTLVSTNQSYPFELMGSNYTVRLLGLPLTAETADRSQEGRLFVATPRDALLGAANLRKELGGAEWARSVGGMRVQSVHVQRRSPVKIMMLPAVVELVEPSQAMFAELEIAAVREAEEARQAEIQAAQDAKQQISDEVEAYKAALLQAASNGSATAEEVLAAAEAKEKEASGDAKAGEVERMQKPWEEDAETAAEDEAKRQRKLARKQALADKAKQGKTPEDMFARAADAIMRMADSGVEASEAERLAAEAADKARAAAAKEAEEAKAAAARGEEVYEEDDDDSA